MIIRKHKARIEAIDNPIEGVYTVTLSSKEKKFQYLPGQFLHLALDSEYDGIGQWPESRCFSMQSNPKEETIRITYSVKGRFTKLMETQLRIGSTVWIKLPYGDLFQQIHNKENTVFIAGGTGVTPYLSLFSHDTFQEYSNPHIYLGFRSASFNIYLSDLAKSPININNIRFFYEDIDGLIDISKISEQHSVHSSYFISGPPMMINSFKQVLIRRGVSSTNILTDNWE